MANKYTARNVIEYGKTTLEQLADKVNIITWALLIIVGSLLFTLGGILNDSWANKQATFEDLKDSVIEQNFIIKEQQKDLEKVNEYLDTICKTWRKDCPIP